jgi:hypothetical protein
MGTGTRDYRAYVEAEANSPEIPRDVFRAELDAVEARRVNFGLRRLEFYEGGRPSVKRNLFGIGLSGGGIRSSTFCLGVLQSLEKIEHIPVEKYSSEPGKEAGQERGLLKYADYLSTVSGGGYIGSCLSSIFAKSDGPGQAPFPFQHISGETEPETFRHLREHSNYLKPPVAFAGLRLPAVTLRGLLINSFILLPFVLFSVIVTAFFFKGDIRDALQTYRGEYTIRHDQSRSEGANVSDTRIPHEKVHIDLKPMLEWPTRQIAQHSVIEGSPAYIVMDDETAVIAPGKWKVTNIMPDNIVVALNEPGKARDHNIVLTTWAEDNIAYRMMLGTLGAWYGDKNYVYPDSWINKHLCNARQYTVPISKCAHESGTPSLRLGEYIGWKRYVLLSGLPSNTYSDTGKFLSEGRWLFTGEDAEKLRLPLYIPTMQEDIRIRVSAWQTRESAYETHHYFMKEALLYNSERTPTPTPVIVIADKKGAFSDSGIEQSVTDLDAFYRSLEMDSFRKSGNIYAAVQLPDGELSGMIETLSARDCLSGRKYIFGNDKVDTLIASILSNTKGFGQTSFENPIQLRVWTSGEDRGLLDPVTLIFHNAARYITSILALVFLLLAISPSTVMRKGQWGGSQWKSRDFMTRMCGFVLLVALIAALLCLQPVFIYYFYSLKEALQVMDFMARVDTLLVAVAAAVLIVSAISSSAGMISGTAAKEKTAQAVMGMAGPIVLWLMYLNLSGWILNAADMPEIFDFARESVLLFFCIAAILTWGLGRVLYNVNFTSLHPFYRDRLSKAFMIAIDSKSGKVVHHDDQKLNNLNIHNSPYHLINAALNIRARGNTGLKGRNAEFFIFSRNYIGSQLTGYCNTADYEKLDQHMGLATAMAISGGAVAPNMGHETKAGLTMIMALFNLRLGYWLQNPRRVADAWVKARVGPWHLLKEMLGLLNEKSKCIYVSDGGHIENIGLYELVRRRCKYIIIIDAEADGKMEFNGLTDAIRMIRIDMGIKVDIDLSKIYREETRDDEDCDHFVEGRIVYRKDEDGQLREGRLLYIKSSIGRGHNSYIETYKKRHPDFPHESTADQFFDEEQFEAYRALGAHVGDRIVRKLQPAKTQEGILGIFGRHTSETPLPFFQAVIHSQSE